MESLDLVTANLLHPLVREHVALAALALFGSTLGLPLLLVLAAREARRHARLPALLLAVGTSLALAVTLQQLGGRPRPEAVLSFWPAPPTPSLPSGHAALAAALAVVLAGTGRGSGGRLLAVLVAGSRVALGHHHASDVLAGVVLGIGVGLAASGVTRTDTAWTRRLGWLLPVQLALVVVISLMAWLGFLPTALLGTPGLDKVLHCGMFGLVVLFAALLFRGHALSLVVPFGLALCEEVAQGRSPRRTSDPLDLAADLLGMVLAFWLARHLLRRPPPREGEARWRTGQQGSLALPGVPRSPAP